MADPSPRPPRRGLAIASLVLGILSLPTLGLLLIGAMLAVILGVVALVRASREPGLHGGRGMATAGIVLAGLSVLVMPFVLGFGAAIAVPIWVRAQVRKNEEAALADVRAVMAAEARYQQLNGGYFDWLECLAGPRTCLPGHTGTSLIEGRLASPREERGYRRRFFPGPVADPLPPRASRSSMVRFAYVASPARPGRSGVRSFCGDASGLVCALADGTEPDASSGACPEGCRPLR